MKNTWKRRTWMALCLIIAVTAITQGAWAQHLTGVTNTHLQVEGGTVLVLGGHIIHNGTSGFSSGSELRFINTSSSNLSGLPAVSKLALAGGGDVSLGSSLNLTTSLELHSGRVVLNSHDLSLASAATITGTFSSSSMIVATGSGSLLRGWSGTGTKLYPVGDITGTAEYSPVELEFTSGSFSNASAGIRVVNAKHPQNSSSSDYLERYWTVAASGVSSYSCTSTFTYVNADIHGTEANMAGGRWATNQWYSFGSIGIVSNTVLGTSTGFGEFTAGEPAAVPVELIAFSAVRMENEIVLRWKTVTEINNLGFEIQRAHDKDWERVGFVQGAGTSAIPRNYEFSDRPGPRLREVSVLRYRLRQIDRDGTSSLSPEVSVHAVNPVSTLVLYPPYPNPASSHSFVNAYLAVSSQVRISVLDILGRERDVVEDGILQEGFNTLTVDVQNLPRGMYFIRLESPQGNLVRRLTVFR